MELHKYLSQMDYLEDETLESNFKLHLFLPELLLDKDKY